MYIIQNALKNLVRNKGRNILLGIIIFSMIATTVVSLAINRAASAVISEYKQQFGSEVSFQMNPEKAAKATDYRSIGNEELLKLGNSDTLQKTQWTAIICGKPQGLKALDEDTQGDGSLTPSAPIGGEGASSSGEITVIVYASDRSDISDDFKKGIREITDGRVYQEPGECIISRPFAELNKLSVGDKFTVNEDLGVPCELTVSGIFRDDSMTGDNTPAVYNFIKMPITNRYNEILTGFNTYTDTAWRNSKSENTDLTPVYYLKSPDLLEKFNEEAHAVGIPEYYEAKTDSASYNRIVGPVEGLAGVSKTFLIIVLILGCALLVLVSVLAMRERKYEIGVLRAMGMKKAKVAVGLVTEMLALTLLCLVLGFGIGSAVSQPVADGMLRDQIKIAEENEKKAMESYGGIVADSESKVQPLAEVDVSLDAAAGAEIALIAVAISLIASAAGVAAVTKYEPMKILSERN